MTRAPLPNRRRNETLSVEHAGLVYQVTYGRDTDARVAEVFCDSPRAGSHAQAIVRDACILMSQLLQRGMTIAQIANALGEDRAEGQASGPPSSPLGAIARAGATL